MSQFKLEVPTLVDEDLAVIGEPDGGPFEGPRRRTFEVDACEPESASVTRAFEFLLGWKVVRRASQMRADGDQCVEAAGLLNDIVRAYARARRQIYPSSARRRPYRIQEESRP